MTLILVLLGGALGAPARYLTDLLVQSRNDGAFPWGTFVVNVVGSFMLGVIASAVDISGAPGWLLTLLGTGFCGALTTFSPFGFETIRLLQEGALGAAVANVAASVVIGLAACEAGWQLVVLLA
jgi:CrcB protein